MSVLILYDPGVPLRGEDLLCAEEAYRLRHIYMAVAIALNVPGVTISWTIYQAIAYLSPCGKAVLAGNIPHELSNYFDELFSCVLLPLYN